MIDSRWLDRFGYVRTKQIYSDSGNGVYYSIIAKLLGAHGGAAIRVYQSVDKRSCLLMRNPENSYGNTSHDDYLAMAVDHLRDGYALYPRAILLTTILNLGYLKNCPYDFKDKTWIEKLKQIAKPFLLIYPAWWIVMIAAAWPNRGVYFFARVMLRLVLSFQSIDVKNASGTQLTWLVNYAILLMGNDKPMKRFLLKLRAEGTSMSKIMIDQGYWQIGHPVLDGYDKFTERMIG